MSVDNRPDWVYMTPHESFMVALIAIHIATQAKNPKAVLYKFHELYAEQLLPPPCDYCDGVGETMLMHGLGRECPMCKGAGSQGIPKEEMPDGETVYQELLMIGESYGD